MKIAGHTMGTPDLSLIDAAKLFKNMGLDAIELIFQDGYKSAFNWESTNKEIITFKNQLIDLDLEAACVVSYASDYNQKDKSKRDSAICDCLRCIEIASLLSAKYVRIYGGTFLDGDTDFTEKRAIFVDSMRYLADEALNVDVCLVIENHFNTMTTGPNITYNIVNEINKENVGILYDQANITFQSGGDYKEAIQIQKDKIFHVHVKDLVFKNSNRNFNAKSVSHVNEDDRAVSSRVVGEGILDWPGIIKQLHNIGYKGYLSLEYEKRWHPNDLPPAEIGMKSSMEYLHSIIKKIEGGY